MAAADPCLVRCGGCLRGCDDQPPLSRPAGTIFRSVSASESDDQPWAAFSAARSNAKQQKAVGSLQFQTSQHGGVIPLVYGTTRVSPNLIDYDDFKATAPSRKAAAGKGGGGGKGGGQQYKYSASVIMGLCQGPIAGIGTVWWDKNIGTLSSLPAAVYLGSDGQAADPYWETDHADEGARLFRNRNCRGQQFRDGQHCHPSEFLLRGGRACCR